PTQAPTDPQPAQMAFHDYSDPMYADWDPWQGHGWYNFGTSFSIGWYDDGVKNGVIVPIQTTEGWALPTVLASPAPTLNAQDPYHAVGTMYVSSTNTHDGLN